MNVARLALVAVLASAASLTFSQNLTSRLSTLNYQATYGGGGDTFTPSESAVDNELLTFDTDTMAFSDSRSGFILGDPGRPWGADVSVSAFNSYITEGPLDNFTRILAQGRVRVEAASSGEGLANMTAVNPGSELKFEFSLASAKQASLEGYVSLAPDGQTLHVGVALQRFDGIVWANVFNSAFLPGEEGTFNNVYNLSAGNYRLVSYASGNAFHGVRPFQDNSWNYDFQVVPEPGTMSALALGLAAVARRRKRG